MNYYLAVDIGASSGRHILSWLEDGRMHTREVYRFDNGIERKDGELCWNHDRLFNEIVKGMAICKDIGMIPASVGIDTWGVDFVLLDGNDNVIGNTISYRDDRTQGMDVKVSAVISERDLYHRTGNQKAMYNTIYQLMSLKCFHPDYLEKAESLLFTPDYFSYMLCGVKKNEYTIASTSQLLDAVSCNWDKELIEMLGFPGRIFNEIVMPGTVLGKLRTSVAERVGYECNVIAVTGHDTASAFLAVPTIEEKSVFVSSGTWSLMGVERLTADCSDAAMKHNMASEGGYNRRYRFLKNIMGMWMIQSVKKESGTTLSYAQICDKASHTSIDSTVDCYDERFLAPESMIDEIANACEESGQQIPADLYETANVVYKSLAKCYASTIAEIEELTGEHYTCINIVGGGSNAEYLNRLTAQYTGRTVYAGPSEATAIGNLAVQMISSGEFANEAAVRRCIFDSYGVNKYE